MKVYSYIVTHDSGFSPNPFHGVCTLACCKPKIRQSADVGDLIIGLSSLGRRVVYAMEVAGVLDFTQYWNDPKYLAKRPVKASPLALDRRGDNIYQPCAIGEFRQLPSQHSHDDGSEKGFDSDAGGCANPIMPDGTLLPLPIPDKMSPIHYEDVSVQPHSVARLVSDLTRGKQKPHFGAHLDPDLAFDSFPRLTGWRALFGQSDRAQSGL